MKDFVSNLMKKLKFNDEIEKVHPKFWRVKNGDVYLNFGEYGQEIEVACFSQDGSRVLTVKHVNQAEIFEAATGNKVGTIRPTSPLEGSKAGPTRDDFKVFIESAALDQFGNIALLGLNDGTAGLFDVKTGERLSLFHHPDIKPASCWSLVKAVAFSNDYTMALVGFFERSIGIWNVETKELVMFLKSQFSERYFTEHAWGRNTLVSTISLSIDNRYVFVGYSDMTAEIWDIVQQKSVFSAFWHRERINALQHYGSSLIWATSGGNINIAQLNNKNIHTIKQFNNSWSSVAFYKNMFLCVTQDLEIKLGNLNGEYKQLGKLEHIVGCASFEKDIGFLKDGSYYYPSDKQTIQFMMQKDERLIQIDKDTSFPISVVLSPSCKYIVAYADKKACIYSLESFHKVSECVLEKRMYPICITDDDRYMIVKNEDYERDKNSIYFWDIQEGKFLYALKSHTRILKFVAFSPSLEQFISADYEKVVLWKMHDRLKLPEIAREYEISDIENAVFLDENRILLIGQRSLELWSGLKKQIWLIEIPHVHNRKFVLSGDKRNIMMEFPCNSVADFDLSNGKCINVYGADFPRPRYCGQGYNWDGPGGPYLHQGEGPRGWITPQSLSKDRKLVVLQWKNEVILSTFDEEMKILIKIPFRTRLRASCILEDKILLLSNEGSISEVKYER